MRTFDEFEKNLIRKIIGFRNDDVMVSYSNLMTDILFNKGLCLDRERKTAVVLFPETKTETLGQQIDFIFEANRVREDLIKTTFLLNYLEKNGYILLYENMTGIKNPFYYCGFKYPVKVPINDKNIASLICEYFFKSLFISQELVDLVSDNFVSKEEIRHNVSITKAQDSIDLANKSLFLSRIGIWLSFGIGIISIIMSLISLHYTRESLARDTKIDSNQLKLIQTQTDSISELKNRNDSVYFERVNKQLIEIKNSIDNKELSKVVRTKVVNFPKEK